MTVLKGEKGGGKGGGGGSQRVAKEAPNTLQSNNLARIIDLLGEGEIEGLVNGNKSVFFDKTPLANEDGSFNFEGVTLRFRPGTPNQTYIPGFPSVESENDVSAEVLFGTPITRSVTNLDANRARVKIQIPQLTKQNTSNGDLNPYEVEVSVHVRPNGGAWTVAKRAFIRGKTVSTYQEEWTVNLDGTGPWEVRMQRESADDPGSEFQSRTFWSSYTEVVDAKLSYPDSALIGLEVDAQSFGTSVPSRAYHVRGLKINVPSNYNPLTRVYSGIWDGTFKKAWTDNPAWVFYDAATRVRYGAGLPYVDKWSLYTIAKYCDGLVPDGFGGQEPRFTVNTVVERQQDAYKFLDSLASVFRGMSFWASDTILPVADMPEATFKRFGLANIEGDFEYSGSAANARHSVAMVTYNDPNNFYEKAVEPVQSDYGVQKFGWRQTDVTAFACSSRGQAIRVGKWILDSEENETQTVSFTTGTDGYDVRPGKIIEVSDPNVAGARLMGRIIGSGTTTLTLDKVPAELTAPSGWTIAVVLPNGSTVTRGITNVAENVVTLASALPSPNEPGAVWMLSHADVSPRKFRVLTVTEKPGFKFQITALEHDSTKYARVELGIELEPDDNSLIPSGPVTPPTNLQIQSHKYRAGGTEHQAITVSWSKSTDSRVTYYILEGKVPDGYAFETLYTGAQLTFTVRDAEPGVWSFRVRAATSLGFTSPWVVLNQNVAGLLVPLPPTSVDVILGSFSITLIPKGGIAGTQWEFWRSASALTEEFIEDNAVLVGVGDSLADQNLVPDTLYFYYIRGVNLYGVSDWYPVQATTENDPEAILKVLSGQITSSELAQGLATNVDKIPDIIADLDDTQSLQALRDMMLVAKHELSGAAIATSEIARVEQDRVQAQRITTLQATMDDDITAAIQQIQNAYVEADNALAEDITNVQVQLGEDIVSVEQKATAALNSAGDWKSQYMIKLDVNGYVSGFGTYNNGRTSSFIVRADQFAIIPPGQASGEVLPFIVSGNTVYMRTALIQDGTITNAKIANGSITNAKIVDAQITRAKIANGSIDNAHIINGQITNAKIANASINRAKITNAAVDTLQIAGNAVTIPASAYYNGSKEFNDPWTDLVTVAINSQGAPVDITATWVSTIYINTSEDRGVKIEARLLVNNSLLADYGIVHMAAEYSGGNLNSVVPISLAYRSGGYNNAVTYRLQVRELDIDVNNPSGIGSAYARHIFLGVKGVQR